MSFETALGVLPDGRLASAGDDGQIKLWPKDGKSEPVILAHGSQGSWVHRWRFCPTGGSPPAAPTVLSGSGLRTGRANPLSSHTAAGSSPWRFCPTGGSPAAVGTARSRFGLLMKRG